ncbi:MAG: type II secretion system protein [Planctomycetota bacterium]
MITPRRTQTSRNRPTRLDRRRPVGRAFTIVELTVSIGVLALIGVGLAAVFSSVGSTVQAGRRVSALTETAAQFERRFRRDVENMARDGFLVIRNEWAANGNPVRLSPEDETPRPRRVDEILFFARDDFQSARDPIVLGLVASSNEARVYYGHGQAFEAVPFAGDIDSWSFGQPFLSAGLSSPIPVDLSPENRVQLALGVEATDRVNPNAFAADWMLLRDVMLLKQPRPVSLQEGQRRLNSSQLVGSVLAAPQTYDSDVQVAMQPAARSVFRSIASMLGGADGNDLVSGVRGYVAQGQALNEVPWPEAGLVDIATTDLAEIRTTVTRPAIVQRPNILKPATWFLRDLVVPSSYAPAIDGASPTLGSTVYQLPVSQAQISDTFYVPTVRELVRDYVSGNEVLQAQQAWMADALPGPSFEVSARVVPGTNQVNLVPNWGPNAAFFQRTRRRFEPAPPGFYRNLQDSGDPLVSQVFRSDKAVLTASNFGPRCTEFIVEWSFGETGYMVDDNRPAANLDVNYDDGEPLVGNAGEVYAQAGGGAIRVGRPGEMVWYGAERYAADPETATNPDDVELVARPLPRGDPRPAVGNDAYASWRNNLAQLIHGRQVFQAGLPLFPLQFGGGGRPQADDGYNPDYRTYPLTSFFGYADPRNQPEFLTADGDGDGEFDEVFETFTDTNGDGVYQPGEPFVDLNANEVFNGGDTFLDFNGNGQWDRNTVFIHDDLNNNTLQDPNEVGFEPGTWPWPKFLRVTASFADPTDPLTEATVQFVVELPQTDRF